MAGGKPIFLLIVFQGFYLGSVCQEWTVPSGIKALNGSCVEIPCTYRPARTSGTSSTVWYLYSYIQRNPEILNTGDSSSVMAEYRDRTSLVPGENSCTLRIDPVRRGDDGDYYPGIREDRNINAYKKYSTRVFLDITDSPRNLVFYVATILREGEATTMRCTAEHTCGSSPPSLQWNKPGQTKEKSVKIFAGIWREESELTYIPSYVDDGTRVQCTATYPNGQKTEKSETLNIEYAPIYASVIVMEEVMEGRDMTLHCKSFSKPAVDEYDWYKGKTKLLDKGQEITVRNVTWDVEPYSCAVRNYLGKAQSSPRKIPVQYAPRDVTVTINGNDEVVEGSDVRLQCSSFSNPGVYVYEWHKGKTKLPDRGREITVRNVTRDTEPYSCAAGNGLGRGESPPTKIPVQYEGSGSPGSRNVILPATIGTICSLLLVLLVYFCWRKRSQMRQTSHETTESPDATYTDLIKNDIEQNYEQLKTAESPEATYADLIKSDVGQEYEKLKFGNSAHITIAGGHVGAEPQYENIH